MTVAFTAGAGDAYFPRMESDLGNPFSITGEADTVAIEETVSLINAVEEIALTGGTLSLEEIDSVPVLTLTTP